VQSGNVSRACDPVKKRLLNEENKTAFP
jgi:hypothetical protein